MWQYWIACFTMLKKTNILEVMVQNVSNPSQKRSGWGSDIWRTPSSSMSWAFELPLLFCPSVFHSRRITWLWTTCSPHSGGWSTSGCGRDEGKRGFRPLSLHGGWSWSPWWQLSLLPGRLSQRLPGPQGHVPCPELALHYNTGSTILGKPCQQS